MELKLKISITKSDLEAFKLQGKQRVQVQGLTAKDSDGTILLISNHEDICNTTGAYLHLEDSSVGMLEREGEIIFTFENFQGDILHGNMMLSDF